MSSRQGRPDSWLVIITVTLIVVGLLMVSSASTTGLKGALSKTPPLRFTVREFLHIAAGLIALLVAVKIDYEVWYRHLRAALVLLFLLVVGLQLFSGSQPAGQTAARWIRLGPVSFQPSVPATFLVVLLWARSVTRAVQTGENRSLVSYLPPFLITGAFAGCIYVQPDLGTAVILVLMALVMMFLAGAPLAPLAGSTVATVLVGIALMVASPWRRERLLAFLDPWSRAEGAGYQIVHSLFAFARGGLFGVGIAEGKEKALYLPECHTDFIFSVIGEEFGLLGTSATVILFFLFLWRGYRIATRQKEILAYYTAMGITSLFGIQALINIAVVTNLLPTKGLTLPFISYGGTATVTNLWAAGILLHLSARGQEVA